MLDMLDMSHAAFGFQYNMSIISMRVSHLLSAWYTMKIYLGMSKMKISYIVLVGLLFYIDTKF